MTVGNWTDGVATVSQAGAPEGARSNSFRKRNLGQEFVLRSHMVGPRHHPKSARVGGDGRADGLLRPPRRGQN